LQLALLDNILCKIQNAISRYAAMNLQSPIFSEILRADVKTRKNYQTFARPGLRLLNLGKSKWFPRPHAIYEHGAAR
jgi:hypothetical protein